MADVRLAADATVATASKEAEEAKREAERLSGELSSGTVCAGCFTPKTLLGELVEKELSLVDLSGQVELMQSQVVKVRREGGWR